jgi:large-conductance mechanosensitive channel
MAENGRHRHQVESTEHLQIVANGSNIRFEPAKSSRNSKNQKQRIIVSVAPDISPIGNFLGFLKDHAVVGLIIGFVVGNQVQSVVKQVLQSFVDPLTKLLFGTALSDRTFTLHFKGRYADFGWGSMIYALIIFLFVLIFMYISIRLLKLDKLEPNKKEY